MPFPSALKNFSENGFFELKNAELSSKNIQDLERSIKQLKENKFSIPLRIRLKDIQMIPDVLRKRHDSGSVITHVPRRWADGYGDVAISQMGSLNGFTTPLNFGDLDVVFHPEEPETPLEALQKALLSLLTQSWSSIELDQLFFCPNHQLDAEATQEFYSKLLNSLAQNSALQELSISFFSLSKQINLTHFLAKKKLKHLHLNMIEADSFSWEKFCRILEQHPTLQSLNLGNSALNSTAFTALADLLDKNYQIEITLTEPTDPDLLEAYQPLKQHLAKSGLERFKEKYLSQDNLFQMAVELLESLKKLKPTRYQNLQQVQLEKQFDFLLRSQDSLAITNGNYTDVLRPIYQKHHYLINEESPSLVKLRLDVPSSTTKTVGSTLLEKALETNNQKVVQTLLNANVNLLEFPPDEEEPFLVKALQSSENIKRLILDHIRRNDQLKEFDLLQLRVANESKTIGYVLLKKTLQNESLYTLRNLLAAKADLFEFPLDEKDPFLVKVFQSPGALKNFVVDYIRRDSRLIQLTSERLKNYSGLLQVFTNLKNHLDKYSLHLVKKDNPSLLMSIAYEALTTWNKMLGLQNPSEARDKECAQIYKDLDESLKVINQSPLGLTYAAFSEVQKIMHRMKGKSVNALRGIFNVSSLHDKAIKLVDEFDDQLKASKDQLLEQQDKTIQDQAEQIKQLTEDREKEQKELKTENTELKIKQTEKETQLDETKEKLMAVEEELAETKAKQADMEAKQHKLEVENAEIKAESSEIRKTLEILLKRTSAQATPEEETADQTAKPNVSFFRR